MHYPSLPTFASIPGILSSVAGVPVTQALTTVGSGTWTVPDGVTNLDEVLIVAGGGSGGSNYGSGGGGGGGLIHLTNIAVSPGDLFSYTVGAGGVTNPTTATRGTNGGNSSFGANTAIGGGAGGAYNNSLSISPGANGGSGGGGGMNPGAVARAGGTGTVGQGNAGGNAYRVGSEFVGGPGGGAGAAGANSGPGFAAPGGVGLEFTQFAAFGDNGWFAGGGNSGLLLGTATAPGKVNGGGGFDGSSNGIANSGGGGLGGGEPGVTTQGGDGGSGIVLISYSVSGGGSPSAVKYIRAKMASNQLIPSAVAPAGTIIPVNTVVVGNGWPFTGTPAGEFTVPADVTKVVVNLTLMNSTFTSSDGLLTLQVNGVAVTDILFDDQFWSPGQLRALLSVAPGDVIRIRYTPSVNNTLAADHVSITLLGYA